MSSARENPSRARAGPDVNGLYNLANHVPLLDMLHGALTGSAGPLEPGARSHRRLLRPHPPAKERLPWKGGGSREVRPPSGGASPIENGSHVRDVRVERPPVRRVAS